MKLKPLYGPQLASYCVRRGANLASLKDEEAELLLGSINMLALMGHIPRDTAAQVVKLLRLEEQAAGLI